MLSKRVCVLGAGNAGLMAALILKREKPGLEVYVVGSSELGIVGVGESQSIYCVVDTYSCLTSDL